jgi:hypothetical protein
MEQKVLFFSAVFEFALPALLLLHRQSLYLSHRKNKDKEIEIGKKGMTTTAKSAAFFLPWLHEESRVKRAFFKGDF